MTSAVEKLIEAYSCCVALILTDHEESVEEIKTFGRRMVKQSKIHKLSATTFNERKRIEWILTLDSHNLKDLQAIYTQIAHGTGKVERTVWSKPRRSSFWDHDMLYFSDEDWIANFRMRKKSFEKLVGHVYDEMSPKVDFVREPVETTKRIAIALYKISSCAEYRTVGNLFGVHKSTVKKFLYQFCEAILKILFNAIVKMPDGQEAYELSTLTEVKTNVPMAIGFIDGTHIPILPPDEGRRDFINRKQYASVVLQAVVDVNLNFRNISCVVPGSCHDATALKESNIFKNTSSFIPSGSREIENVQVPYYLIGDPAYPLLPWLMKPYPNTANMTAERESFNVYTSAARVPVEIAFGRLKGRWRIVLKRVDLDHKFVPKLVAVCCTLHNFCEAENSPVPPDMNTILSTYEDIFPQPVPRPTCSSGEETSEIRQALCQFMSQFPLRQSVYW